MESYEVLREAAEKVGVKALAAELRLSPALVYKWCQEPESEEAADASGARNPLDRMAEVYRLTRHLPVVEWLCREADGFFVGNPKLQTRDADSDLLAATQQMVEAFSKLLAEVSRSMSDDGRISAGEADRIRASWERLKTIAETFVVACEHGLYLGPPQ